MIGVYKKKKQHHLPKIIHIPDNLWNEVKNILPPEKPSETIGRPIVPFRKVLDGILYVLRTGCQWKMLPKEYGSGSTCHRKVSGVGWQKSISKVMDQIIGNI